MKASELLEEIKENLKDYPIEYLKNKVTDDRYKDPLTKQLAKYNSETWDEIFALNISEDYEIKDGVVENIKKDITKNNVIILLNILFKIKNNIIISC